MHGIQRFILIFVAMNGLGIAALVAQFPTFQTVPQTADIDVVSVHVLSEDNTLRQEREMKFYQRADDGTRLEEPNRVVVVDNSAETVTVLDPVSKIARIQAKPTASARGANRVAAQSQSQAARSSLEESNGDVKTDLGIKMIAGHSVHGILRTTAMPANSALGNTAPMTKTIQVWNSSDLRLPLLTVISDPLGRTTTSQYENISTATPPDSSLFTIPAGYKAVQSPRSRVVTSHTN